MSLRPFRDIKRRKTKVINVGKVKVGGENPILVQSMTNTLTTNAKETISQIDDFTGSPYDQDSIIDLGQYFADPDFYVGDRLTFEVETAEPIGYLYDGTALKWIDTDTINYQHSGTDRFDDLLMTRTFTFIDSGLTIKTKDQQDRISATVSPQTVNQVVEFNFEDGSSLIFMLDHQYLAGDLNGTLTLSRSGLFNNSVVDPNTGKAKLAVKSEFGSQSNLKSYLRFLTLKSG